MAEDRAASVTGIVIKLSLGSVVDTVTPLLEVFGSPAAGTPIMAASPLAALDLPLKVLVWDDGGQTKVCYQAPAALAARYGVSADLVAPLGGIDALTDALATQRRPKAAHHRASR